MSSVSAVRPWGVCEGNLPLMGTLLCATGWSSTRSSRSVQRQSTCLSQLADMKLTRWCNPRPLRIPLSSFIVEDMMEYVHAHATYRFILHDDEEERPRILVCRCSSLVYY